MSDVYNPENVQRERIETLEVEARRLARRMRESPNDKDRAVLQRQLREVEQQVRRLRRLPPMIASAD